MSNETKLPEIKNPKHETLIQRLEGIYALAHALLEMGEDDPRLKDSDGNKLPLTVRSRGVEENTDSIKLPSGNYLSGYKTTRDRTITFNSGISSPDGASTYTIGIGWPSQETIYMVDGVPYKNPSKAKGPPAPQEEVDRYVEYLSGFGDTECTVQAKLEVTGSINDSLAQTIQPLLGRIASSQ